jgi:hypothetical protein
MAATTAAVVGIVATGASTVMSFTQAAKQQGLAREAQAKADQAMQDARKKLEVNYYKQLGIQKEPYELQREALLVQGAQALEGAREADRGAAATAGRLQAMQNEAQAGVRTAMGKELMDLEALTATEESRLRDVNVQLDMGEVAGAQQAISDAEQARAASMTQGMQGIAGMASYASQFVPLYMESASGRQLDKQMAAYNKAATEGTLPAQFKGKTYQQALGMKYGQGIESLNQSEFIDYMGKMSKSQIKNLYNPLTLDYSTIAQQQAGPIPTNYLDRYTFNRPGLGQYTPNYNIGRTLPASMGGQYDPFNLFK